jgi:hypothetical protein
MKRSFLFLVFIFGYLSSFSQGGVNQLLPYPHELGVIYNKNSWTSLSDFTVFGGLSTAITGNKIVVNSGSGSFTQGLNVTNLTYPNGTTGSYTMLEHWNMFAKIKITTISSTSFGGCGGIQGKNPNNANSMCGCTNLTTNTASGNASLYDGRNGTFSNLFVSTGNVNSGAAVNDYLALVVERNVFTMTVRIRDITQGGAWVDTSFEISPSNLTGPYINSSGQFTLFSLAAGWTLDSLSISSQEMVNAPICFVGDSKAQGYYANSANTRFEYRTGALFHPIIISAGGGDRTVDVINRLPEILALSPKQIIICAIGRNDSIYGIPVSTTEANLHYIDSTFRANGILDYYTTNFYETTIVGTLQELNTYIINTLDPTGGSRTIDMYNALNVPGAVAADNIHLSDFGEYLAGNQLINFFQFHGPSENDLSFMPVFNGGIGSYSPYYWSKGRLMLKAFSGSGVSQNADSSLSFNGGGATGANPTGTVGLAAVNGSSANFMRADAAPPLSQSIAPTMTGAWTFNNNVTIGSGYFLYATSGIAGSSTSGNSLTLYGNTAVVNGFVKLATGSAFDLANVRLGIGTQAPSYPLDIRGVVSGITAAFGTTYKAGVSGDYIGLGDAPANSGLFTCVGCTSGSGLIFTPSSAGTSGTIVQFAGYNGSTNKSILQYANISSGLFALNIFQDGGTGNVNIGTSTSVTSAMLNLASTTQGSIPVPIMTTSNFTTISSKASGLLAILSDSSYRLALYNGSKVVTYATTDMLGTGGTTPNLQQVLTAGSTLTSANTISTGSNILTISGGTAAPSGLSLSTSLYEGTPGVSDANLTIQDGYVFYSLNAGITANRTITLPSATTDANRIIVIYSPTASFTWSFASTVVYADGLTTLTTLSYNTFYTLQAIGGSWIVTNSSGSGLNLRYNHTIFTPTTGGTVALINNQYNIINPSGALVALTVNLPSSPKNNDVVYIKYTQAVTTVTYGNGTVVDGITSPIAGGLVTLTYDATSSSWY